MKLEEIDMDIFLVPDNFYFAHCISSDCAMGLGIAKEFDKRFNIKNYLLKTYNYEERKSPTCILYNRVLNLITKEYYFNKPTYRSLKCNLIRAKEIIISNDIKYLAIPRIGCGLDKLNWIKVKEIIMEIFDDLDIYILVCHI